MTDLRSNPRAPPASNRAVEGVMLAWLGVMSALAQGRGAVGLGFGGGISPVEPSFTGPPRPAAAGTVGLELWSIHGGEDRIGRRGRHYRTPDHQRLGLVIQYGSNHTSALSPPGTHGALGLGAGGQWGGNVYLTAWTGIGLGAYGLYDIGPDRRERGYTTWGPWLRPKLALGLEPGPGIAFEVGPYASVVVPLLTEHHHAIANGRYLGQAGIELTMLLGSTMPQPSRLHRR